MRQLQKFPTLSRVLAPLLVGLFGIASVYAQTAPNKAAPPPFPEVQPVTLPGSALIRLQIQHYDLKSDQGDSEAYTLECSDFLWQIPPLTDWRPASEPDTSISFSYYANAETILSLSLYPLKSVNGPYDLTAFKGCINGYAKKFVTSPLTVFKVLTDEKDFEPKMSHTEMLMANGQVLYIPNDVNTEFFKNGHRLEVSYTETKKNAEGKVLQTKYFHEWHCIVYDKYLVVVRLSGNESTTRPLESMISEIFRNCARNDSLR